VKIDNPIVVLDFETNGLDVNTLVPVEIACLALDPDKLTVIPGSEFQSLIRPHDMVTLDDTEDKRKALAVSAIPRDEIEKAPVVEAVVGAFVAHLKKLCGKKKAIACGYNIERFDIPLFDHLCRQYGHVGKDGRNKSFRGGVIFDLKQDINRLFFQCKRLVDPSFDGVRNYFGMTYGTKGTLDAAHRAMFDVRQEAWLAAKMLNFYQSVRSRTVFTGTARATGGLIELNAPVSLEAVA